MRSIRARAYSIGGIVAALFLPAAASAAVTGQTLSVTATPPAQPRQQLGPLNSLAVALDTTYAGPFTPNATQTVITFSRDIQFNSGGLAQCNLSQISTVPEANAQAVCGAARVGQGGAVINNGLLTGRVAAFNGTPTGGSPTIGLHTDIFGPTGAYAFSTTLVGVLNLSTNALSVSIPPTGTSITHFDTTINRVRTGRRNGQPIYYVMARCPNRQWVSSASTSFDDGQQLGARSVQRCRQTAAKNFGGPQRSRGGKKKRGNRRAPPKNGTYTGKTDQDAISAAFRKVHFHLKNRRVTLTVEPTVARGACVSAPVFTLGGTTASKKLSRNGTFSLTRTFLGNKIDKIHGRWVSSTVVEGYAIYHFHGQDLCSGGKFRVNFRARHR